MAEANGQRVNPHAWTKRLAKSLKVPKKNLLVLDEKNDPYNYGTPSHVEQAEWFTYLYEEVGYEGIHVRRMHYRVYEADKDYIALDGTVYDNIDEHRDMMDKASKAARVLGYVDADAFVDRRAKPPYLASGGRPPVFDPDYTVEADYWDWSLPRIRADLAGDLLGFTPSFIDTDSSFSNVRPETQVFGYLYDQSMQSCIVEIWTEKSGDDPILIPLCRQLGINFIPNDGYPTISQVRAMFRRVRDSGRPGRILYLSDFDPAGANMPVSAGRHTQYALWQIAELAKEELARADIKLEPLAVTAAQVEGNNPPLSRRPISRKDRRRENWEGRFGEGAVEIDALEARHPGILTRLVRNRVAELHDLDLYDEVEEARREAESRVESAVDEVLESHKSELESIAREHAEIAEGFRDELEAFRESLESISARYEEQVGPLRQRLREKRRQVEQVLNNLEVELPDVPGAAPPSDHDNYLLDTERGYLDQTQVFRQHQRKE